MPCISLVFLHREFVPLLPTRVAPPTEPSEPPYFDSEAPSGWWESSAEILHSAATSVADIINELEETSITMMTPLAGFTAFTAAITLSHVAAFPHINHGMSPNAEAKAQILIRYLTQVGQLWKIGEHWVSSTTIYGYWLF